MEKKTERTAIVYYSQSGNCHYVAEKIAEEIPGDLIRLYPEVPYQSQGFRKFLDGGRSAINGELPELLPYDFDADRYDTVIIGYPVWAVNVNPVIGSFVAGNREKLKGKRLGVFLCCSGLLPKKSMEKMRRLLERDKFDSEMILIDPYRKKNSINDDIIRGFCMKLRESVR